MRYENASDLGNCCFRIYADLEPGSGCETVGLTMHIQGDPVILSIVEYGDFIAGLGTNSVDWTGCFKEGSNYLGAVCISGNQPYYTVSFSFFTTQYQGWISCPNEYILYCDIQNAAFCGTKFNDLNCNGVRDPHEPGIPGWTIKAINTANNTTITQITDADGNYEFTGLELAPWHIFEEQQAGWVQTAPATGRYSMVLETGQKVQNLDFGNFLACADPEEAIFLAGSKDDFGPAVDDPPAQLSSELQTLLAGKSLAGFDDIHTDRFFAHSFTDLGRDNCCLVGATLTIRMQPHNTSMAGNDALIIAQNGVNIYSARIKNLLGIMAWSAPNTVTMELDLADLPGNIGTSVLPSLRDGTFDFYIEDDTQVDWVELKVEYCCQSTCCEYLQPFGVNSVSPDDCCFEFGVIVDEGHPCNYSAVRMTVYDEILSINYTGNGLHLYDIIGNRIIVNRPLTPGTVDLGSYCFDAFSSQFTILFEYYDDQLGDWISCNEEVVVYCTIDDGIMCGQKFEDLNCNGVRDPGEPGLAGTTINAVNPQTGDVVSTVTDADGNYKFLGLQYASWHVYETQSPSYVQTYPATGYYEVILESGTPVENLDFGNALKCAMPESETYLYGEKDNFQITNTDFPPVTPSLDLMNFLAGRSPLRGFDNTQINRHFAHSFSDFEALQDAGCCIVGATLTIRMQTLPNPESRNDDINFVQDGKVIYSRRIEDLTGLIWRNVGPTTVVIDLANLGGNRTPSALPALMDGTFDFFIQDDTSIDWVELTVQYCCPPLPPELPTPVDEDFALSATLLTPNPANNSLNFEFSLDRVKTLEFEVVNMTGQVLINIAAQDFKAGQHTQAFDLQTLGQGVYFVRARSVNGWSQSLPFTIVR